VSLDAATNVLITVGCVFAVLVVASVVVRLLRFARPQKDFGELSSRIESWWVMALIFAFALLLHRAISLAFFAFVSFLALKEYLSLIPTRRADRRVLFWAYLSIPFQFLWIGYGWYGMFIIWIPVYLFLFLPMRMVLIGETQGFLRAVGTLHWGLMITVFSVGHVAFLLVLPQHVNPNGAGPALVLYLVLLTECNDVAQFLWGKALGRHRALPTVSPGKTTEGLLGGVATTLVLAVLLAPWLTPLGIGQSLIAGTLIGFGGFIGDVVVSSVKRDIGVKDSGAMLPGHGGILDRLDSLTYTAPLIFHYVWYTFG
jgi:phosphatidate cytidylyltransferase